MTFASYLKVDIEEALKKDGIDLQDLVAPIKYLDKQFNSWVDLPNEIQVRFIGALD